MNTKKEKITDCVLAVNALYDQMHGLDHEEVWIIFMNFDNTVITKEMISKGTLTHTAIDNRTIIRAALLHNAAKIILLHNHPSGDPMPSKADIELTASIRFACEYMNIYLVDHIIVTNDRFFSFNREKVKIN